MNINGYDPFLMNTSNNIAKGREYTNCFWWSCFTRSRMPAMGPGEAQHVTRSTLLDYLRAVTLGFNPPGRT